MIVDYTWGDVSKSVNNCLKHIVTLNDGDIVKEIYDNRLSQAMNDVSRYCFVYGKMKMNEYDLVLIKKAYLQINEMGYIGIGCTE